MIIPSFPLGKVYDDDLRRLEFDKAFKEAQANHAAGEFCVNGDRLGEFLVRMGPIVPEKRVIGFSRLMERHPGIVVGQIQRQTDRYDFLVRHLVKIRDFVVPNALTDGYGQGLPI